MPAKSTQAAETKKAITSIGTFAPYKPKKGEEYMNDAQLAHFKTILTAWLKQLREEANRTVHFMQDEAANIPDMNDRATRETELGEVLRARDRERKLIEKIEFSLSQIESQDYGYCEMCGEDIGLKRLEARPTATLCIDCKTLDEIREKHVSH